MKSIKKAPTGYRLARLYDAGNDLSKQWVVLYYAYSVQAQKLIRKRVSVNGQTETERRKNAASIIKEINQQLKAGAVVDEEATVDVEPAEILPAQFSPGTLDEALTYFLDTKKASMKANSHKTYRSSIKLFRTYLTDRHMLRLRLNQFKPVHAFSYMDYVLTSLGLSNKSHNKHLGVLETFFNFYVQRQLIKANPFISIKPLAERPGRHTAFTPNQVAKVKQACELAQDHQLWLFLNFIYYTLARPQSELRLLRVCDILPKTVRIDADNAKNNRTAHVLIPPPLEKLIEKHRIRSYPGSFYVFTLDGTPGEKPVYEKYFYNQHRRILTLLKLTEQSYDLYGWKHTGVIALYKATKDIKLVQRQCRHSNLDQTDKYLRDLGLFLYDDQLDSLDPI
jgi:integrase